jgi:divalent metal cation (Fe/Co/Zn/Cd) transporter
MDNITLINRARFLALFTILYNMLEGIVSVYFGVKDETLSLFGFGADSFVEVISGLGILHMTIRMETGIADMDRLESLALKITGAAFHILAVGLLVTAGLNIYFGKGPETTFWGILISLVSIVIMFFLMRMKIETGVQLNSSAIVQDAYCTRMCLYLSIVLLLASAGFELTGIGYIDSIGALVIAYFSFKEGKESFEKAAGHVCPCGCKGSNNSCN